MKNIKISIITICYNNERDIRETIESVINQTYTNIEYIVIDGGSRDNTHSIIREYSCRIDKYISEPDGGIYDAINKGIRLSNGYIFGLIHAGDRLFNNRVIENIAVHFEENDIDASYGHSILVNSRNIPVRINKSPKFNKNRFRIGWMPSHQSIYLKKSLIQKYGYYRLDLGGSADYEFVLRYFYFNNIKAKRIDKYIVKFRTGGLSTSNYDKLLCTQKVHIRCWEINGVSPPIFLIPMKLLRKIPQYIRAAFYFKKDI